MKRVCLVGVSPNDKGGVARAMLYLAFIYRMLGYNVVWLEIQRANFSTLSTCDIIHVNVPLRFKNLWLILLRKPRKILTLHGLILDEARSSLYLSHTILEKLKALVGYINISIHWIAHKFILIPLIYDYVTAVAYIKVKKNNVRAIVIPNPITCKMISGHGEKSLTPHSIEVIFGTYVGAGGWIEVLLGLVRIVRVIYLINRRLKELSNKQQVILHVYGDVPPILLEALSKYSFVKFIGYLERSEFIKRLSTADLFIERFPLPELRYITLEAMCVGIPVAKFSMDPESEEMVDGFNGILATSDEEMVEKLTKYILNMDEMKRALATNAKNTIVKNRDPKYIAVMWRTVVNELISRKDKRYM